VHFNSRGHNTEYNVQYKKMEIHKKASIEPSRNVQYNVQWKCCIKNYPHCMSHCELSQNGTKKTLKRRHSGSIIK